MGAPVDASRSRNVSSSLPLASCLPSGLHATEYTEPVCPVNVHRHSPVVGFQILMVPSLLPVASLVPSLFQLTELSLRGGRERKPY